MKLRNSDGKKHKSAGSPNLKNREYKVLKIKLLTKPLKMN